MKMRWKSLPVWLLPSVGMMVITACGSSQTGTLDRGAGVDDSSVSPEVASDMTDASPIANGLYDVIGPLCSSSERTPPYDSLEEPVRLRDFNFLTTRTKEIQDDVWVEIYEDDDCKLTITGGIALNERGVYQQTNERFHQWKPNNCKLTASYTSPEESAS